MLMVSDLYSTDFPVEFLNSLPSHCDTCGEPTEITESLTILRCSNPHCIEKSVQRLVTLLKDLGVKNMGDSKCRQFFEHFDILNPYAIFMYEPSDGPLFEGCSMDFSEAFYESLNQKRKMLLWEYVKIGNLPGIRDSARKLLSDYDSLEEFYDDLEGGGISFVQELLDIKGKTTKSDPNNYYDDEDEDESISVRAVEVYNTLINFQDELFEALEYVEIKQLTTEVINICISTAVGRPYTSKSDFVTKMNEEFGDKVHLNFLGSVSKDCQFLIWSKEGAPTNKVTKAERLIERKIQQNIKEGLPEDNNLLQIMTGLEFKEYLEGL